MRRARKLVAPLVLLSAVLGIGVASDARAQTPPNVLFIINDDHGWPFHSFLDEIAGSFSNAQGPLFPQHPHLHTPPLPSITFTTPSVTVPAADVTLNLDRLAQRGAVFTRGHAADSVCVASYKSTQTGLHLKDFDVLNRFEQNGYPKSTGFVGGYLSQLGYDSFAFGKSWEDFDRVGFTCVEANAPVPCKTDWEEGRRRITPVFDFIVDKQTSPPPRQWYVWYATELPHEPMNGRAYIDAACADANVCAGYCGHPAKFVASKAVELPVAYLKKDYMCRRIAEVQARMQALTCFRDADCPLPPEGECAVWGNGLCSADLEYLRQGARAHEGFFANVLLQDFWVGLLLDFLEKPASSPDRATCTAANACCYDGQGQYTGVWSCIEGVNDDTLVLYQTDNGFAPGHVYEPGVRSTGWKRTSRENGFRTPMLISLPRSFDRYDAQGNLLPFTQSQVRDEPVQAIDLLPTILHLGSGVEVPTCGLGEEPRLPKWVNGSWQPADPADGTACLEGRSLAYAVGVGPTPAPSPRPHLFMQRKGQRAAVLTDDGYRLVRKGCDSHELTRVFDPDGHHDPDNPDYNDDPDERTVISPNALPSDMSPTRLQGLKDRMQCWFANGETTSCEADPCSGL